MVLSTDLVICRSAEGTTVKVLDPKDSRPHWSTMTSWTPQVPLAEAGAV